MNLPIGCLVPDIADQNIHLAVLVHIGNRHAFGAKVLVDDGLLPGDATVVAFFIVGGGQEREGENERNQGSQEPGA